MPLRPPGISRPIDPPITKAEIVSNALQRTATLVVAADNSSAAGKAVADYVVPAGSTSAQTVINQAINALPAVGGKVVLLEGTYIVDGSIVLPSNVELEISKGATVKLKDSFNADISIITNADQTNGNTNIAVTGHGVIDGNRLQQAGTPNQYGINLTKVSNSTIEAIIVKNTKLYNIYLSGSALNSITNVKCLSAGSYGIHLTSSDDNTITGNTCQGNRYGIWLTSSNDNIITGNTCQGNALNGIDLYGSNYNNTVTGNVCQGNGDHGICLAASHGNTVTGNTCQGNGDHGIALQGANKNTVTGNTCAGNNYQGICLTSANKNTVTGNTCQGNGYEGIYLLGFGDLCNDNHVIGNNCIENSQNAHNTYDNICLEGYYGGVANYNNIQGNTCRQGALTNKPRYGIRINSADCDGNVVMNNDLYNSGATGPLSDLGTNTIIRNNRGYSTDSLKKSALSVAIGLSGVYGAATAIQGPSRVIRSAKLRLNLGGTFGTETVTVKVECAWDDGTTTYIEKSYTAVGSEWLTDADWFALWKDNTACNKISCYAKTDAASTAVTCTVDVAAAT